MTEVVAYHHLQRVQSRVLTAHALGALGRDILDAHVGGVHKLRHYATSHSVVHLDAASARLATIFIATSTRMLQLSDAVMDALGRSFAT